jgi:hypothetical protein
MGRRPFRVVQPWGQDKARQATIVSEHSTAAEAFGALDGMAAQAKRTGGRIDAIDLLVVDADGRIVGRPGVH